MAVSLLTFWLFTAAPLKPCSDDVEAGALLEALDAAATRGDSATLAEVWAKVTEHRCFALPLAETIRAPSATRADTFAAWLDAGGREWLRGGVSAAEYTVVPPDEVERVSPEKLGGLARLQCADDAPATCARETAGWTLRATDALNPPPGHHDDSTERAAMTCATEAKAAKKPLRYRAWLDCLEKLRPQGSVLPAGRFRAPTDGWLVLRGRRGHYAFCDELRAYDLKTGAAWVARSCSGLVLATGGAVNHDATDAKRALEVTVGRLPLEALREAAWLTLLATHVQERAQRFGWYVRRPAWLAPELPSDGGGGTIGGFNMWFTSGQTRLAWSWQGDDGLRDSGTLTWPDSSNAGEDYAAALWRIAEAAFEEGCAPARPPTTLVVGSKPGVSRIDAAPGELESTEAKLLTGFFAAQPAVCGPAHVP